MFAALTFVDGLFSSLQAQKKLRAIRITSHLSYDLYTNTSVSFIVVGIVPYLRDLGVLTAVLVKIVLDVMSCVLLYTRRVRKVKIQRSQTCTAILIYKSDTVNELPVHNFIFQHSRRHYPNIY